MKPKPNIKVTIDRSQGNVQRFEGTIIGETSTHYLVTHESNQERGELFAKKSNAVNCQLL
jgi:hypothetical protein